MKKRVSLFVLFVSIGWIASTRATAQIHQPRQRFFETGVGLADGTQLRKADQTGYWGKVGFGKYGKKEGVWAFGLSAQLKYYAVPGESAPPWIRTPRLMGVEQYFLEGTFSPRLFKTADRTFYLLAPVGLLIGYERANDAGLNASLSKGMVGFIGGLNGEVNLSDRTALIPYGRVSFLPSSHVQSFHFQYGMGIRFNYFKR